MAIKQFLSVIVFLTFLVAQGHVVLPGQNATIASFEYDRSVDFFGEGDFLRDNYNNSVNVGYVYNGLFGIDFSYGYSFFNSKKEYDVAEDEFDFSGDFRSNNPDLSDQGFSLGFTYYLNNNANMPVDMLFGLRYGASDYDSDALDALDQDFHKKYYTVQVGAYKSLETNAQFRIVPTLTLDLINEKNIHRETIIIEGDIATEDTVSSTKNHTNVHFGFPIVFDQGTVVKQSANTQFIVEPTLSRVFGETHLGFKVSFLFNN